LVLIELAGSEQSTRRDQFLMELIYERGLPNAGVSGYDDQLGRAAGDDPLEGREQGTHFALPPIQPLRHHEPVGDVLCPKQERVDVTLRLPFGQAALEVGDNARGGLVA